MTFCSWFFPPKIQLNSYEVRFWSQTFNNWSVYPKKIHRSVYPKRIHQELSHISLQKVYCSFRKDSNTLLAILLLSLFTFLQKLQYTMLLRFLHFCFTPEVSLCHTLWSSSGYIFATKFCRPLKFQTINRVNFKNKKLTPSGWKEIEIIIFEFEAKTQFLSKLFILNISFSYIM